jgi:hypothetical protein
LCRFFTTLLIFGLAACGGDGGSGGGGGGIPSATNAVITPPPTTAVAITTAGGATSTTNQSIAANSLQVSDGALDSAGRASALPGVLGVQANNSGTQGKRETLAAIVRRHAEKLKEHKVSVTGALQVATQPCSGGGTATVAFDDANLTATEVFVNCAAGGEVLHGTISSSNVGVTPAFGSTVGSTYTVNVTASFTIDLSIVTTAPASTVVTQGSFNFLITFSGNMEADGAGGVQPGLPNQVQLVMNGASLLTLNVTSNGTVRELLSSFSIFADNNDALGRTTISGNYTSYASTMIGGSVTVNISPALVFQPQGVDDPISGAVTITSSGSPGKIVLTVISTPVVGVRVDVHANASGPVTDTVNLTWAQLKNP